MWRQLLVSLSLSANNLSVESRQVADPTAAKLRKQAKTEPRAYDELVKHYVSSKSYAEAEKVVQELLQSVDSPPTKQEHPYANSHTLGFIQQQQGKLTEALRSYEDAFKMYPTDLYVSNNRCDVLLTLHKNSPEVGEACEHAVKVQPTHPHNYFLLGRFYANSYRTHEAIEMVAKSIELDVAAKNFPEGHWDFFQPFVSA